MVGLKLLRFGQQNNNKIIGKDAMKKQRNPEYDHRDALFKKACSTCSRRKRCSFCTSPEGPEAVCKQLVLGGLNSCEACLRRKADDGVCKFSCIFYHPLV